MTGTTWNSAGAGSGFTLSANDLLALKTSNPGAWASILSTTTKSSGQWYFELTVMQPESGTTWLWGVGNGSTNTSSYMGSSSNSLGFQGTSYYGCSPSAGVSSPVLPATAVILGVAIDVTAGKLWWKRASTSVDANWNNLSTANPATGAGAWTFAFTGSIAIGFSGYNAGGCLLNTGQYAWAIGPPSGFTAWDTADPATSSIGGSSPTTWNPSDKSSDITLSGGDMYATNRATGSWQSLRTTTSWDRGLKYFEATVAGSGNNKWATLGFANSSMSLSNYPGADNYGDSVQLDGGGALLASGVQPISSGPAAPQGSVVSVAADFEHGLWWYAVNGGSWNGNAGYGPSTLLGGITLPNGGPWFIAHGLYFSLAATAKINTGATSFVYTMPASYSAWDSTANSITATGGTQPTTWSSGLSDGSFTLSNGNLTATTTSSSYKAAVSTSYKSAGKWYFELEVGSSAPTSVFIGLGNSSAADDFPGYDVNGIGLQPDSAVKNSSTSISQGTDLSLFPATNANDVFGVAVDLDNGLWWVKNITQATNWNAAAGADPTTAVEGMGLFPGADLYILYSNADNNSAKGTVTLNPAGTFVGSIPGGFASWDTSSGGGATGQFYVTVING